MGMMNAFCKLSLARIHSSEPVVMTDPELGLSVYNLMLSTMRDLLEENVAWTRQNPFPGRLSESDIRARVMSAIEPRLAKTVNWFIETDGLKLVLGRLLDEDTKGDVRRIIKEVTLDGQQDAAAAEDPLTLDGFDDFTKALISNDIKLCMGRSLVEEYGRLRMDREHDPSSPWYFFDFDVVLAGDDGRFYAFTFELQLSLLIRGILMPMPQATLTQKIRLDCFCFLVCVILAFLVISFSWLAYQMSIFIVPCVRPVENLTPLKFKDL